MFYAKTQHLLLFYHKICFNCLYTFGFFAQQVAVILCCCRKKTKRRRRRPSHFRVKWNGSSTRSVQNTYGLFVLFCFTHTSAVDSGHLSVVRTHIWFKCAFKITEDPVVTQHVGDGCRSVCPPGAEERTHSPDQPRVPGCLSSRPRSSVPGCDTPPRPGQQRGGWGRRRRIRGSGQPVPAALVVVGGVGAVRRRAAAGHRRAGTGPGSRWTGADPALSSVRGPLQTRQPPVQVQLHRRRGGEVHPSCGLH